MDRKHKNHGEENTPRHITTEVLDISNKEKILEAARQAHYTPRNRFRCQESSQGKQGQPHGDGAAALSTGREKPTKVL